MQILLYQNSYGNDFKIIKIKELNFLSNCIFLVLNSKSSLYVLGLLI